MEAADVAAELEKIVFDHVIKNRKIRHGENGQDYPYARKLDDRLHGRDDELAIHVITPLHEHAESEAILRMQSMGRDELLVLVPPDDRLVRDLLMYKRTEKYIRQTVSVTQQEAVKRILTEKGFQNRERYAELQQRMQTLLGKAKLLVAGGDIDIGGEDPQTRITRGFQELIARTYPNLRMLRGIAYSENDIANHLNSSQDSLFGNDAASLAESEQELLAFIQSNQRGGIRTTLKHLLERFERKPYGWSCPAILCTLANLCARGKVEVRTDGNLLEEDDLERALRNAHGYGNVVLEPQVDFTASQVRGLKAFHQDFFDDPPQSNEAKALGKETGVALQTLVQQLSALSAQSSQYPFLTALTPVIDQLKALTGKPYNWYLTELTRQEDALLDMREGIIDPIRKFMSGPQKGIFDRARSFVQIQEPNFAYIEGDEAAQVSASLTDPACFKGDRIQRMKTQLDALKERIDEAIQQTRAQAIKTLKAMQSRMQGMDDYQGLPDVRKADLDKPYQDLIDHFEQQQLIAVINDRLRYFEDQGYQKILARMVDMATPKPPLTAEREDPDEGAPKQVREPRFESIHSRQIQVAYDKAWLADETDVDRYLESMRLALLAEIRKGKRIQI